jgi:hypothetical protein
MDTADHTMFLADVVITKSPRLDRPTTKNFKSTDFLHPEHVKTRL